MWKKAKNSVNLQKSTPKWDVDLWFIYSLYSQISAAASGSHKQERCLSKAHELIENKNCYWLPHVSKATLGLFKFGEEETGEWSY